MYKCINNSAPDYLCNLFDMNTNSNVYSLRSFANGNLFVPRPNSNFMKLKKIAPSGRKRENFWGISCDPLDPPLLSQIVIFRCEYVCIVWNVFAVFDYYCFEGHREDWLILLLTVLLFWNKVITYLLSILIVSLVVVYGV